MIDADMIVFSFAQGQTPTALDYFSSNRQPAKDEQQHQNELMQPEEHDTDPSLGGLDRGVLGWVRARSDRVLT